MSDETDLPTFLGLSAEDQRDAYLIGAEQLGKSATVLEKDVWVCWTLDALFSCPGMPHMAFKGGTSLSKVFDAISRFSEDIDVTMDHNGLKPDLDPYEPASRKQRDRDDEALHRLMCERSMDVLVPHLKRRMAEVGLSDDMLVAEKDGEVLTVQYPHLVEVRNEYYREGVKIEFGGRNMIEPNEKHTVAPYIADSFDSFSFPSGEVSVLSPKRTFWEKVTLAHAESNRTEFKNAERTSRHWHDLAVLAEHEIGRTALLDINLLRDVVRAKERFFRTGTSHYDLCLAGAANLLPDDAGLLLLKADYQKMVDAEMLDAPLLFDEMVERVRALQDQINAVTAA